MILISVLTIFPVMFIVSYHCLYNYYERVNSCLCVCALLITLEPLNVHSLGF